MAKNCEVCGKKIENPDLTHCSDECLFKSVKSSRSIFPEGYAWKLENFEPSNFENSFEQEQIEFELSED